MVALRHWEHSFSLCWSAKEVDVEKDMLCIDQDHSSYQSGAMMTLF